MFTFYQKSNHMVEISLFQIVINKTLFKTLNLYLILLYTQKSPVDNLQYQKEWKNDCILGIEEG